MKRLAVTVTAFHLRRGATRVGAGSLAHAVNAEVERRHEERVDGTGRWTERALTAPTNDDHVALARLVGDRSDRLTDQLLVVLGGPIGGRANIERVRRYRPRRWVARLRRPVMLRVLGIRHRHRHRAPQVRRMSPQAPSALIHCCENLNGNAGMRRSKVEELLIHELCRETNGQFCRYRFTPRTFLTSNRYYSHPAILSRRRQALVLPDIPAIGCRRSGIIPT